MEDIIIDGGEEPMPETPATDTPETEVEAPAAE
jgi:hypothetical protein